jgi:hypothetical protein
MKMRSHYHQPGQFVYLNKPKIRALPTNAPRIIPNHRDRRLFNKMKHFELADAIEYAEDVCEFGSETNCYVAWDIVEEMSSALAKNRERQHQSNKDLYEAFCQENPSSSECLIYDL